MTFVMLRSAFVAFALLAVGALMALDTSSQVKKVIQGSSDSVSKLWLKKDLKGLQAHFQKTYTDDYTTNSNGVKRSRKQAYEGLGEAMARIVKVYEFTSKVQSVELKGPKATAKIKGKILADMQDDAGQKRRLELYQDVTSNWVKLKGTWKCQSSVTKSTKMLVDGVVRPIGG
jgi:hypothetical protein